MHVQRGSGPALGRRVALALVVVLGTLLIAACGGSSSSSVSNKSSSYGTTLYGALPTAGTPARGGDVTVGQISGQTADYILPLIDCTHYLTTNINFVNGFYVPLFNGPVGARPEVNYQLSAASGAAVPSNGDKTYTIHLRSDLKWSDGKPVDADDVLFSIDLIKAGIKESAANWCGYIPGQFPSDLISATAPNPDTVVLKLSKPVNPGYLTSSLLEGDLWPMPSTAWNVDSANGPHLDYTNPANATKIFNYLYKAGQDQSAFTSSPLWNVIDGAWKLSSFSTTNGSFTMTPNPKYTGPAKPKLSEVSYVTYTGSTAELEALKSGALDIGGLDATQLAQAPGLRRDGYTIFGNPTWGFYDAIINFDDGANHFGDVIKQLYARQALYELMDEPALIKGIYKNAAVPQYGTVPSQPQSPYTPSDAVKPLYPYSPARAVATLKAHGWKVVPGGTSTCQRPGTAANECGANIPKGTPFAGVWLNVPEDTAPSFVLSSEVIVSEAKKAAGIDFSFKTVTFNTAQEYNDQLSEGKALKNDWAINNTGGIGASFYPTTEGLYSTGGSQNDGDYNDATADKLMLASVSGTNPRAVVAEASYLAKSPPVLFLPDPDALSVVSTKVGGSANSFLQLVYQILAPQYWYLKKAK